MNSFIKNFTFPIFLTVIRIILSLTALPFLMFYLLPLNSWHASKVLVLFCGFLSATDFFDGFLARKYKQETFLGAWLDPLADKCFVGIALFILMILQRISFVWFFLIMAREFVISFLRLIAQVRGFFVPVVMAGKLKTVVQYVYIMWMVGIPWGIEIVYEETITIWILTIMVFLSVGSGLIYGLYFVRQWQRITKE